MTQQQFVLRLSCRNRPGIVAAVAGALRDPQVTAKMAEIGFEVVANSPEEFAAFQGQEIARWKHVVQAGNITPD